MNKFICTFFLFPALFVSAHAQTLPTADQVIAKYIKALGGKKALTNVKDMSWQIAWPGSTMTYKQKAPAKSMYVMSSDKGQLMFKIVTDGTNAVEISPQGSTRQSGLDAKRSIIGHMLFPELAYKQEGIKSTVAGIEPVDSRDAYKVISTFTDGSPLWTEYYDVDSGLKVQQITTGQDGSTIVLKYVDYKDVDGVKVPFGFTSKGPSWLTQAKVNSVKINKGVSDAEFVIK